jgi:hypothetical protein
MSQEKFEKIYFNVTELKSENITNYSITSLNNNLCNDEKINQDNQYRKQQFSHIFKTFSNKSELINSKKTKFCENNCLALNETSKNCILVKKKICNQYFFPGIMSQISIKPCLKRHVVFSFLKEIEDVYIKKNETANFKAIVHISEPFEIKWFIEKLQINTSLRKLSKIEKINDEIENLNFYEISLIIENSSYDDIGKYSLSIENEACHAICSAFLIIEGK